MQMNSFKSFCLGMTLLLITMVAEGQAPDSVAGIPVNYDETMTGKYNLPDPLELNSGKKVKKASTWFNERRPEILKMFHEYQYGQVPEHIDKQAYDVFETGTLVMEESVVRSQVRIFFSETSESHYVDILIYLPEAVEGAAPLMLMINFTANATMVDDPDVRRGTIWNREHEKIPAPEESRFGTFDIMPFINQGIGVAMVYYGDIEPDFPGGAQYGIRGLFQTPGDETVKPDAWGAIAAWAWGLSCVMDYFETDDQVDASRVALFGISRLGKTVLWTGANDPRFAMVIASCSGEGGAALSSRNFGETIGHLTAPTRYPYQFCQNYGKLGGNFEELPMDAHMLLALLAPRPVLLQTGNEDLWSDPKGEFLAAKAAEPVYQLFGKKGLDKQEMPQAGETLLDNSIGYYMHDGGHGTKPEDYQVIIEFLKKHL